MIRYELVYERDESGRGSFNCTNKGLSAMEIIGILTWKISDIERQLRGEVKPDVVKRTVVKAEEGGEGE
jgi:hypothetical protein